LRNFATLLDRDKFHFARRILEDLGTVESKDNVMLRPRPVFEVRIREANAIRG
jgi:hypothetical protein